MPAGCDAIDRAPKKRQRRALLANTRCPRGLQKVSALDRTPNGGLAVGFDQHRQLFINRNLPWGKSGRGAMQDFAFGERAGGVTPITYSHLSE